MPLSGGLPLSPFHPLIYHPQWGLDKALNKIFNGPLSRTTLVSRYQKGKTNLDFTEARDSEWQWHQLGYMQVCTSLQTDNKTSTPPLFFTGRPTNSVKALKAIEQDRCHLLLNLFCRFDM